MLHIEPFSFFEAYEFLLNVSEGFSIAGYFDDLSVRHPDCAESYMQYKDQLIKLEAILSSALTVEHSALGEIFTQLYPKNRIKNGEDHPTLCSLFLDTMHVFVNRETEQFFNGMHEFCPKVPSLIVEAVTGGAESADRTESYTPAEIFRIINASALSQNQKNAIIDAALDPHKFVEKLRAILCPIAEKFDSCRQDWEQFIQIYCEDYSSFSDCGLLLKEKLNYTCGEEGTFDIYPTVMGFNHCNVFTGYEPGEEKHTTAIIGVLFERFRAQSDKEHNSVFEASRIMNILGEPSRFKIILRLMQGPAYVGELAKYVGLAPCTVSQHISTLLGANLVTSFDSGRRLYLSLNHEKMDMFAEKVYSMFKSK